MSNNKNLHINDRIDFREFFSVLWDGKFYVIICVMISIVCASLYLRNAQKKYTVEYKLKPVSEKENNTAFGGMAGLSSIAGINLTDGTSADFKVFRSIINSVDVFEEVLKKDKLVKELFFDEWNEELQIYNAPSKTDFQKIISNTKKLLTGSTQEYLPPNARRLAMIYEDNIKISKDKETGFLFIKSQTSQPKEMVSFIVAASEASDDLMRERYILFSKEPLTYYKEKLRTARSREHREALAQLISVEEQKLMLASRGKYFIAEPLLKPSISLYPTSPKPASTLVFFVMMGFLLSTGVILMRNFNSER